MKFIILSYAPTDAWPPEEHKPAIETSIQICHELAAQGQYIHAAPLQPISKRFTCRYEMERPVSWMDLSRNPKSI